MPRFSEVSPGEMFIKKKGRWKKRGSGCNYRGDTGVGTSGHKRRLGLQERDAVLVKLAVRGDAEAFQTLVAAHVSGLFSLCDLLVGNRADAEDVLTGLAAGCVPGFAGVSGAFIGADVAGANPGASGGVVAKEQAATTTGGFGECRSAARTAIGGRSGGDGNQSGLAAEVAGIKSGTAQRVGAAGI